MKLQIFKSEKFGEVRVQVINEIPYFNLNDCVCDFRIKKSKTSKNKA